MLAFHIILATCAFSSLIGRTMATVGVGNLGSAITDSGTFVLHLTKMISMQGRMPRGNVIVIENKTPFVLKEPSEWMKEGVITSIPADEVPQTNRTLIKFSKKEYMWIWKGSIGVLTYSIGDTGNQLVIYWSVPWNNLADKNKANVRIKRDVVANQELFQELKEDEAGVIEAVRSFGQTSRTEAGFQLYLSMTNSGKAATFCEISGGGGGGTGPV